MTRNGDPLSIARQLQQADLFSITPRLVADLFGVDRAQSYAWLDQLQGRGLVAAVEKGKYLLLGLEPERILSNPLFIATQLVTPAYVSFWSALHYHGLTEQVPRTVLVATTRKKQPVTFGGHSFRYVHIQPHRFFGYQREMLGGLPVLVADQAKALVDSLALPRYAGGVAEVSRCLALALPDLDLTVLVEYANRMGDRSLASRLGYLLERLGRAVDGLHPSAGPVLLDPQGGSPSSYDSRWRVRINLSNDEVRSGGVG
jgi:predicted transcriptional regulator of viral defense system